MIQIAAIRARRERAGLSERRFAERAHLARATLRAVEAGEASVRLRSIINAAEALGCGVQLITTDARTSSDCSVVATAFKTARDGESSWKLHVMDFVDEFRRTLDARLLALPPPRSTCARITALIASVTWSLCAAQNIEAPDWAQRSYFLPKPWFVAKTESLKASAILESPLPFRRNNIFVLENFLSRM